MNPSIASILLLLSIWLIAFGATRLMRSKLSTIAIDTPVSEKSARPTVSPAIILAIAFTLPLVHAWIQNSEGSDHALAAAPLQVILLVLAGRRSLPRQLVLFMAAGSMLGYAVGIILRWSVVGCSLAGWGAAAGLFCTVRVVHGLTRRQAGSDAA